MKLWRKILYVILGVGLLMLPMVIPDNNGSPTEFWSCVFILWFFLGFPTAGALIMLSMTDGQYYPPSIYPDH